MIGLVLKKTRKEFLCSCVVSSRTFENVTRVKKGFSTAFLSQQIIIKRNTEDGVLTSKAVTSTKNSKDICLSNLRDVNSMRAWLNHE